MASETMKAAYLYSRSAAAMVRAMGMQAENMQRVHRGEPMAYTEVDFQRILDEEEAAWGRLIQT